MREKKRKQLSDGDTGSGSGDADGHGPGGDRAFLGVDHVRSHNNSLRDPRRTGTPAGSEAHGLFRGSGLVSPNIRPVAERSGRKPGWSMRAGSGHQGTGGISGHYGGVGWCRYGTANIRRPDADTLERSDPISDTNYIVFGGVGFFFPARWRGFTFGCHIRNLVPGGRLGTADGGSRRICARSGRRGFLPVQVHQCR